MQSIFNQHLIAFGCLLLLAGCVDTHNCAGTAEAKKKWLNYHVTTREELHAEIQDLIQENSCDGITPATLRKVLLDMEAVR